MGNTPVFIATPNVKMEKFENGDGTTKQLVFTAGSNGSRVESINVGSNDTSANKALLYLRRSAVDYLIGFVVIPLSDGDNPIISVSLLGGLSFVEPMDEGFMLLDGDTLYVAMNAAVTAAKETDVTVFGGDF